MHVEAKDNLGMVPWVLPTFLTSGSQSRLGCWPLSAGIHQSPSPCLGPQAHATRLVLGLDLRSSCRAASTRPMELSPQPCFQVVGVCFGFWV